MLIQLTGTTFPMRPQVNRAGVVQSCALQLIASVQECFQPSSSSSSWYFQPLRGTPPSLHLRPLQTSRTFPLLVSAVFPLHHQRRRSTNTGTVSAAAPVSALILWFAAQIKDCGRNLGSRFQEQHKLTAKHQACSLTVLMLHVGHFLGRFQYFLNILYFWLYERINKKLFLNYSYFALYILDSSYFAQQLLHNSFLQDR